MARAAAHEQIYISCNAWRIFNTSTSQHIRVRKRKAFTRAMLVYTRLSRAASATNRTDFLLEAHKMSAVDVRTTTTTTTTMNTTTTMILRMLTLCTHKRDRTSTSESIQFIYFVRCVRVYVRTDVCALCVHTTHTH